MYMYYYMQFIAYIGRICPEMAYKGTRSVDCLKQRTSYMYMYSSAFSGYLWIQALGWLRIFGFTSFEKFLGTLYSTVL